MAREIIVELRPDGTINFEHIDSAGDECLTDQFMRAMKERGEIVDQGFTDDHNRPQPVAYATNVRARH